MTTVGFVGLGIIGSALSANLIDDGVAVVGFDVDESLGAALARRGGRRARDVGEVAVAADVVMVAVASTGVLPVVASEIAASGRTDLAVVDLGTLPLAEKLAARDILAAAGIPLLDCTISGTGAQAVARDLVFMASGDAATVAEVTPLLMTLGREVHDVGEFGNGIRMKLVANHLVAAHTAAAAEALLLAERAGLDLAQVLEVVGAGAGTSRMFEVRGPMIAGRSYGTDVTARVSLFRKDLRLITEFADAVGAVTPLLDTTRSLYEAAAEQGLSDQDAAAVHAVLERLPVPGAS